MIPASLVAKSAAGVSGQGDARAAAREIAAQLEEHLVGRCDLLMLFASFHHRAGLADAGAILRGRLEARVLVGCTAESVLGGALELEGRSGMAALALRLPGTSVRGFRVPHGRFPDLGSAAAVRAFRRSCGVGDEHRATFVLADPFSTSMPGLLEVFAPTEGLPPALLIGGMASGASQPGQNVLLLDDTAEAFGAVGVSLSGAVRVDVLVSQGCRPIGSPMLITKVDGNLVQELGGKPAIAAAQEMASRLSSREQDLLAKGVLIGVAISEYRDRFGRGDFLIRPVLGGDRRTGAIAVGDRPRVGQTVQFHVRDDEAADEDLRLLLDAQQLDETPLAALLFTCSGRGTRLFSRPNHDASVVHQRLGRPPLAGFFAAGEIGPVAGRPFVHGHTAVVAAIRT